MAQPDAAKMVRALQAFAEGRYVDDRGMSVAREALGLAPRTYEERARTLADDAIALIQDHERRQHPPGERCADEVTNILAFLAHSLGVYLGDAPDEAVQAFIAHIRDYGAVHEEHDGG